MPPRHQAPGLRPSGPGRLVSDRETLAYKDNRLGDASTWEGLPTTPR